MLFKTLSIKQPWALFVVHGSKDIENRSWRTSYRGPVLIHASKAADREALRQALDLALSDARGEGANPAEIEDLRAAMVAEIKALPLGQIVGLATLADVLAFSESEWFEGPLGWLLANRQALAKPWPASGRLGLWNCEVPVTHPAFPIILAYWQKS